MARKTADCREYPDETGCTLTISGEEEEVVTAAVDHAISVHGHQRTSDLEREIRNMLKDEVPMPRAPESRPSRQAPSAPR